MVRAPATISSTWSCGLGLGKRAERRLVELTGRVGCTERLVGGLELVPEIPDRRHLLVQDGLDLALLGVGQVEELDHPRQHLLETIQPGSAEPTVRPRSRGAAEAALGEQRPGTASAAAATAVISIVRAFMNHLRVIAVCAASSVAGWNVAAAFDVDPMFRE